MTRASSVPADRRLYGRGTAGGRGRGGILEYLPSHMSAPRPPLTSGSPCGE
jgi:hypothetical protein